MSDFKNKKITILYERLSAEDDRDGDSNSIISQRNLLQDYAERHGFTPYQHISDDGFSGTDWQRPGWQALISKIEAGEVNCVLVKDSSRIGRDFLRVGLFRDANVKHRLKKYELFYKKFIKTFVYTKTGRRLNIPRLPVLHYSFVNSSNFQ